MTTKQIHETHIKIAFFAMLLIMLAAIYVAIPDFYSTVWQLSTSGNMQGTIDYLRSFGAWAVLVSMIIDIVINIVGFLPSIFISTANGVLFGVAGGTVVSWVAETIGVIISFFFMRTLFRNKAKKVIEKSKMLSKLDHYSTWQAMTLARPSRIRRTAGHGPRGAEPHQLPRLYPGLLHRQIAVCRPVRSWSGTTWS